jgi:hypothetical protein
MLAAFAAGHSAVCSGVSTSDGRPGFGVTWKDRWLNQQWLAAPAGSGPQPVPFLADPCFAVTRSALEAVGGFDPDLGAYRLDTSELCLRLWRSGRSCAVTPGAVTVVPEAAVSFPDPTDWPRFIAGMLRMATVHLDADDLAYVVEGFRALPDFPGAVTSLLGGDCDRRRQDLAGRGWAPASAVLDRFGIEIDPAKLDRARRFEPEVAAGANRPQGRHSIVFVGGLHGSGADLVAGMLAGHPAASGFHATGVPHDEGQHLQDVYPPARLFGGPGKFALDPDCALDETSERATPVTARRLFGQWSPRWDLSRPILIEQSPPNLIRTRFLQALFPASRFVMVMRHPVVSALASSQPLDDLEEAVENWFAAWARFEVDRPHLEHAMVIRFEDLVAAPVATIDLVAHFAGLDGRVSGRRAGGLDDLEGPSGLEVPADLRARIGSARAAFLEERFASRAAAYGYQLLPAPAGADLESVA